MAEQPNTDIETRLRALCRQITVADDLDPEIQEELLGHMEDKFHAYLEGSEAITEEDAFILVREHFGDPAHVKALFQHTHVREATLSLGRRLAAVAAVTLVCYIVMKLMSTIGGSLLVWAAFRLGPTSHNWVHMWMLDNVVLKWALALIVWGVVYRWRHRIDHGSRPGFLTRSPMRLTLILSILTLTLLLTPVLVLVDTGTELGAPMLSTHAEAFRTAIMVLSALALLAQAIAWLWWCDRPPRTTKTLSYTTLAWLLVGVCNHAPAPFIMISRRLSNSPGALFSLTAPGNRLTWSLGFFLSPGYAITIAYAIATLATAALAARVLYWLAQRARNRRDATPLAS